MEVDQRDSFQGKDRKDSPKESQTTSTNELMVELERGLQLWESHQSATNGTATNGRNIPTTLHVENPPVQSRIDLMRRRKIQYNKDMNETIQKLNQQEPSYIRKQRQEDDKFNKLACSVSDKTRNQLVHERRIKFQQECQKFAPSKPIGIHNNVVSVDAKTPWWNNSSTKTEDVDPDLTWNFKEREIRTKSRLGEPSYDRFKEREGYALCHTNNQKRSIAPKINTTTYTTQDVQKVRCVKNRWTDVVFQFQRDPAVALEQLDKNGKLLRFTPKELDPMYSSFTSDHIFNPKSKSQRNFKSRGKPKAASWVREVEWDPMQRRVMSVRPASSVCLREQLESPIALKKSSSTGMTTASTISSEAMEFRLTPSTAPSHGNSGLSTQTGRHSALPRLSIPKALEENDFSLENATEWSYQSMFSQ